MSCVSHSCKNAVASLLNGNLSILVEPRVRHPGVQGNSAGHLSCVLTALLSNVQGDLDLLQLFEDGARQTFTLEASKQDATI